MPLQHGFAATGRCLQYPFYPWRCALTDTVRPSLAQPQDVGSGLRRPIAAIPRGFDTVVYTLQANRLNRCGWIASMPPWTTGASHKQSQARSQAANARILHANRTNGGSTDSSSTEFGTTNSVLLTLPAAVRDWFMFKFNIALELSTPKSWIIDSSTKTESDHFLQMANRISYILFQWRWIRGTLCCTQASLHYSSSIAVLVPFFMCMTASNPQLHQLYYWAQFIISGVYCMDYCLYYLRAVPSWLVFKSFELWVAFWP